jgi:hypothetical protein
MAAAVTVGRASKPQAFDGTGEEESLFDTLVCNFQCPQSKLGMLSFSSAFWYSSNTQL